MSENTKPAGELRGIFGRHGDSPRWLEATRGFKNGVPRFQSKAEAEHFMKAYNTAGVGSNPSDPTLKHIFTMLTSWDQIEKYLLPAIEKARSEPSRRSPHPPRGTPNTFSSTPVEETVKYRLDLPFHKSTNPVSTMNTLKYLFYHMKCGIFVMIKGGELRIFSSFVNKDYRNTWGDAIKLEGDNTIESYYMQKQDLSREENIDPDRNNWWANGNIICNEHTVPGKETQYWGDHFSSPLRDMLVEACRERSIPDCEFFINKRDYPHLKVNVEKGEPVEPYGFIFDKDDRDPSQDVDLHPAHKYTHYAPIVSFYAASPTRFADIPFPSSEDWEGACGEVFCNTFYHKRDPVTNQVSFEGKPRDLFTEANFRKFECTWEEKVNTAFFRGTATGGGTTIDDNQRLKSAYLSHSWKNDPEKGGGATRKNVPFLDAAIVGWNMRDKKVHNKPMTFLRKSTLPFDGGKQFFTPIYMQSRYKYLLYIDGHCAACRYGFMMRLGSVILKVKSRQVADTMWYFPLLQSSGPLQDHVEVKEDLSDLEEKIRWCRENDGRCRQIAANCKSFYDRCVARNGLLDYLELITGEIASRFTPSPSFHSQLPIVPPPSLPPPVTKCYKAPTENGVEGEERYCLRCQDVHENKVRKEKEEEERKKQEKVGKVATTTSLRDRMLKKRKKSVK
mmetsp:Transcript_12624/g.25747  ORF Transcript_12624/g.25747 Transcript_12624/m.25747 type:complete len:673 (-) Transcript_12624:51-2069(-)